MFSGTHHKCPCHSTEGPWTVLLLRDKAFEYVYSSEVLACRRREAHLTVTTINVIDINAAMHWRPQRTPRQLTARCQK